MQVQLEWERMMIQKLKAIAGAHFTNKMEKMVVDISMQSEAEEEFSNYCGAQVDNNGTNIRIQVQVLTRSNWPAWAIPPVKIPGEIPDELELQV